MKSSRIECPISARAAADPDLLFAVVDGIEMSYRQFDARVREVTAKLNADGIQQGDRVAFRMPNCIDAIAIIWACFRLRVIACPISSRMPDSSYDEIVAAIEAQVPYFTSKAQPTETAQATLDENVTATLILSSGSTGGPKVIAHQIRAHFASARASNANIPLSRDDRWLLSLPVYHVGGLAILFRCIEAGAAIVIDSRKAGLREQIESHSITHVSMVSTQLKRMLQAYADCPKTLKAVLLGGGSVPFSLVRHAVRIGIPLYTTYGLSEMASQVTTTRLLTESAVDASGPSICFHSGSLIQGAELRVASGGEILVRGSSLMQGYWREGTPTAAFDDEGWFHTKDLGVLDRDGNLIVHGRADNMFISGGENIHPEEIEARLMELPGVRQAVVVSIPDTEYGARPVAFVDADDRVGMSDDFFRTALQTDLARFKIPDRFLPWPDEASQLGVKPRRRDFVQIAIAAVQRS